MNEIKEARIETGYSMLAISKILSVPYRTWQNWESGSSKPPLWAKKLIINELKKHKKVSKFKELKKCKKIALTN